LDGRGSRYEVTTRTESEGRLLRDMRTLSKQRNLLDVCTKGMCVWLRTRMKETGEAQTFLRHILQHPDDILFFPEQVNMSEFSRRNEWTKSVKLNSL
jgi:hypothetical protein